jgi:phosphoribosylaminoimidazole-succinocarboxamide synthase
MVKTIFGEFDETRAKKFRRTYEQRRTQESFEFEFSTGKGEILTSLAKYLLEFLENAGLKTK